MATVSRKVDDDLFVRSKVGRRWRRDRFRKHHTPAHKVTVENRAGEEVDVEVEITTGSSIININGATPPWRSSRMTHGGLLSRGKRIWPYQAMLSFTGADPNQQIIQIKIYRALPWLSDGQELPLVGEVKHAVWVK